MAGAVDPTLAACLGRRVKCLLSKLARERPASPATGDQLASGRPERRVDDAREAHSLGDRDEQPAPPGEDRLDVVGCADVRRDYPGTCSGSRGRSAGCSGTATSSGASRGTGSSSGSTVIVRCGSPISIAPQHESSQLRALTRALAEGCRERECREPARRLSRFRHMKKARLPRPSQPDSPKLTNQCAAGPTQPAEFRRIGLPAARR